MVFTSQGIETYKIVPSSPGRCVLSHGRVQPAVGGWRHCVGRCSLEAAWVDNWTFLF